MKNFKDFNFNTTTNAFIALNNFENPTPIQEEVIPLALKGKDLIAISNTGTGKTHAFLIPLMNKLNPDNPCVQAVISAPTRELALQIYNNAKLMNKADNRLKIKLITGGIEREKMAGSIKSQPHLVIGTPGRIKDLFLNQSVLRVDTARIFVVDEADMTLEYGFLGDIDAICGRMGDSLQMMVFSATIPAGLKPFLKKYMHNPVTKQITSENDFNPHIEHILIPCKHKTYSETLIDMLPGFMPYVCLIFANTRSDADKIASDLRKKEYAVIELHGGLEARQRKQAMKQIEANNHTYVVATDIAARGIDIEEITHVISCGFPSDLSFYIHRAGRTARKGQDGICYALYHEEDAKAIKTLKEQGVVFEHKSFSNGQWRTLKPYGQGRITKNDLVEKEIAKKITKKKEKVKPGYKKKKAMEIQKIKRKEKRDFIRKEVKEQKKEMFKNRQKEINSRKSS